MLYNAISIKTLALSIMSISIDLHVKCPFYKKWNKKKSTIFFSHYHMVFGGTNGYIIVNILSQGAVFFFQMSSIYKSEW